MFESHLELQFIPTFALTVKNWAAFDNSQIRSVIIISQMKDKGQLRYLNLGYAFGQVWRGHGSDLCYV